MSKILYKLFRISLKLLFIVPILLDLFLTTSQLAIIFQWSGFFNVNISLNYFLFAFGATIFTYLFYIIVKILSLIKRQNKYLSIINNLYSDNRKIIIAAMIFTSSTFLPFLIMIFIPYLIPDFYKYTGNFNFSNLYFPVKFLIITIIFILVKKFHHIMFVKILSFLLVIMLFIALVFFTIQIYQEFQPNYYFTFPLDDKKGRYLINYDGDYWLTYYEVQNSCLSEAKGQPVCKEVLVKKGNTSIIETPVDLKQYIDVPIHVSGEFVKTYGSTYEGKQICVGQGFSKECSESTGPGIWYASPLKIKIITVDK